MDVYWADYEGSPVYYATVQPGESYMQTTYATHPWGGMVNGELIGVFILSEENGDKIDLAVMEHDGMVMLLCPDNMDGSAMDYDYTEWDYDYDYDYDYSDYDYENAYEYNYETGEWEYATGDCGDLECSWVDCTEMETKSGIECWKELCFDDCGDEVCTLWHWEAPDWITEECGTENYSDEDHFNMAGDMLMAFNDTLLQSFDYFCANGSCIEQGAMMAEQAFNITGVINAVLNTPELNEIAQSGAEAMNEVAFEGQGPMDQVDAVLNAQSADQAAEMVIPPEAPTGEDLLGLLASFFGY